MSHVAAPGVEPLSTPLAALPGVGPERAAQLARLGLRTIGELLLHRPRRYEDRRRLVPIARLGRDQAAVARGTVVALGLKRFRGGAKSVFELILDDGTARLHCRWWNLPYMQRYFAQGDVVLVYGKLCGFKPRAIDHPETEVVEETDEPSIHLNRVAPVYPLTEGLPQRWLRALVWRALARFEAHLTEPRPGLAPPDLPSRAAAIRALHFPAETADAERARQRLALDEFLDLQLAIQGRRKQLFAHASSLPCAGDNRLIKPFLKQLGFELTAAQTAVLREIRRDLGSGRPMRRLLQGDVGSGKTVVAACSALMALESGYRAALMVPTEILADQHFATFSRWFTPLGVEVHLRTGARRTSSAPPPHAQAGSDAGPAAARGAGPAPGRLNPPQLTLGTHALIEAGFVPENLGLVIIDEQHKFGVAQREQFVRKGHYPHLLVMTATPIPRTLGLTLYGDLDISVIDRLPAGRGPVKTFVRSAERLPKVWEFIRAKLAIGRQAYVVYPRVTEGDDDLKAVTKEFENLSQQLAPFRVGLVHGRLRAEQRERVMADFRANRLNVLLATTVIEVGVDVPNATVLLVENAEQFGLAQLHQLRGRIGRGGHPGYCILVADLQTPEARQRLKVLEETADGFRISEADLNLRGPGEFLGQQQSGLPPFRFGDLQRDRVLIERAHQLAAEWLARTP
ncbi:MAG: ATP-dependent DNA helicase RecG [Verrucomicrobia bacterium]|nr:ATP-dependent DNA helicase RecG [Verrucomicrobiota bacterium]